VPAAVIVDDGNTDQHGQQTGTHDQRLDHISVLPIWARLQRMDLEVADSVD
jgi:hypothetical protein